MGERPASACSGAWLGRESLRAPRGTLEGQVPLLAAPPLPRPLAAEAWAPAAQVLGRPLRARCKTGHANDAQGAIGKRESAHGEAVVGPHIKDILELTPVNGGDTEVSLRPSRLPVTTGLGGGAGREVPGCISHTQGQSTAPRAHRRTVVSTQGLAPCCGFSRS